MALISGLEFDLRTGFRERRRSVNNRYPLIVQYFYQLSSEAFVPSSPSSKLSKLSRELCLEGFGRAGDPGIAIGPDDVEDDVTGFNVLL